MNRTENLDQNDEIHALENSFFLLLARATTVDKESFIFSILNKNFKLK